MLPFSTGRSGLAGIPALSLSARAAEDLLGRSFRALVEERDRAAASAMAPPGPIAINQQVEATADIERAKGQAANVLALLRGVGGGPAVVVGAHYDHLGLGGTGSLANDVVGEVHNGADDNASGTACVLELARVLSRGPAPRGDVLFALWSGEELGLLGSEHWARNPTIDLEQVSANLNLDMVGRVENGKLQILGAGSSGPFEQMLDELASSARFRRCTSSAASTPITTSRATTRSGSRPKVRAAWSSSASTSWATSRRRSSSRTFNR
jgi:Zn-dependent M28 family amino/carboxypeptidase